MTPCSFHREIPDQSLNLESSIHVLHFRKQPSQFISQVDNLCEAWTYTTLRPAVRQ